jgi:hypothetical protein
MKTTRTRIECGLETTSRVRYTEGVVNFIHALAKLAGRSVQTVSGHLAKLRALDMVRYDSAGKEVRYWLKHRGETRGLLKALEKVVRASGKLS